MGTSFVFRPGVLLLLLETLDEEAEEEEEERRRLFVWVEDEEEEGAMLKQKVEVSVGSGEIDRGGLEGEKASKLLARHEGMMQEEK